MFCCMQGVLRTGADLLAAVAEEVQVHLPPPMRQSAAEALSDQADDVLTALGVALAHSLRQPAGPPPPPPPLLSRLSLIVLWIIITFQVACIRSMQG